MLNLPYFLSTPLEILMFFVTLFGIFRVPYYLYVKQYNDVLVWVIAWGLVLGYYLYDHYGKRDQIK